jgi:hypothetical protein
LYILSGRQGYFLEEEISCGEISDSDGSTGLAIVGWHEVDDEIAAAHYRPGEDMGGERLRQTETTGDCGR